MIVKFHRPSEGRATQAWPNHQICQFFGRFGGLAGPVLLSPCLDDGILHSSQSWLNDFTPQFSWRGPFAQAWKFHNNLFLPWVCGLRRIKKKTFGTSISTSFIEKYVFMFDNNITYLPENPKMPKQTHLWWLHLGHCRYNDFSKLMTHQKCHFE